MNERQIAEMQAAQVEQAATARARAVLYLAGVLATAIGTGWLTRWPAALIVVGVGLVADAVRRQEVKQ
jgi:hypothetical protein